MRSNEFTNILCCFKWFYENFTIYVYLEFEIFNYINWKTEISTTYLQHSTMRI